MNNMTEIEMWYEYNKINMNAPNYEAWSFGGNTPEMPDFLADLVLRGIKMYWKRIYRKYDGSL